MRLTTFSDYTLRVLIFLAIDEDRRATIPEIAAAFAISENHLTKVAHQLGKAGLIDTLRGKGGGIRLARDPAEIRLGEVVRRCEGEGPIVECLGEEQPTCRIAPNCRLSDILAGAFETFYRELDAYTLADLVGNRQRLARVLLAPRPVRA